MNRETEKKDVIGTSEEDGFPVIWKFVNEFPSADKRKQLPWLAIISWEYDGRDNNGMPHKEEYERMLELEAALESGLVKADFCAHVYNRTGNNLKEFVFYIRDKEHFLEAINQALSDHAFFPIEITFCEDTAWKEFKRLLKDFSENRKRADASRRK